MSTELKTNLKPALATVKVSGVLSEKHFEHKDNAKTGKPMIEGTCTVKVDDINFIPFRSSQPSTTAAGTANQIYAGLKTVEETFKPISEVGEADADKLTVSGDLNMYTHNGKDLIGFKGTFYNRPKSLDSFKPEATFEVETYIRSIASEVDKDGIESGNVLVRGWVPQYDGSVQPITLIAPQEDDIASAIQQVYKAGDTARFFGTIINSKAEYDKNIPVAVGKPRVQHIVEYKNALIIASGSAPYGSSDDYENHVPYDKATIDLAVSIRDEGSSFSSVPSTPTQATTTANTTGRKLNF